MSNRENCFVIGVYGYSNSGKTWLIANLIRRLSENGYRCASVKCSDKHSALDNKDKDTWLHADAGAQLVVFSSPKETVFFTKEKLETKEIVEKLSSFDTLDIILIEGARDQSIPKIRAGSCPRRHNTVFDYRDNIDELLKYIEGCIR